MSGPGTILDDLDRRIVIATQAGLPLVPQPYESVARDLGIEPAVVMERLRAMQSGGGLRRIGAVPNHYALGYRFNGMTVWDVPDERVGTCGRTIGALGFVSHAYHRPRHLPLWPYNLFAMVHGRSRREVEEKTDEIVSILGSDNRGHRILYSTRILKKTGLRLAG